VESVRQAGEVYLRGVALGETASAMADAWRTRTVTIPGRSAIIGVFEHGEVPMPVVSSIPRDIANAALRGRAEHPRDLIQPGN